MLKIIKRINLSILSSIVVLFLTNICAAKNLHTCKVSNLTSTVWTKEKAAAWYANQPWLIGANFQPSTAINQVEMWSADSFDAPTIDKELGWAEELGFNLMRVYLSSEVWKNDPQGLKKRIDEYLTISDKHGIKTLFVIFDDCWNEETIAGKQPAPKPGVHNSGWVQDPAVSLRADTAKLYPVLEKYVKDIISSFKDDKRILLWDLYNEPGNSQHGINSLPLLRNVFKWARQPNPTQPLTAGVWYFETNELNVFQLQNSDVISYHNYVNENEHQLWINLLKTYDRPLICTEYMARRNNSRFQNILPLLKRNHVGAINWGFVSGKTNTIFAWDEPRPDEKEPPLWFHDIYRQDKTPFDPSEVEFIKKITGKSTEIKLLPVESFNKTIDSKKVSLFTLKNKQGMTAQITNFGGRVVSLWVADKNSKFRDIVAGKPSIDAYLSAKEPYLGALIGRYGNRIANGKFTLNGKEYILDKNNGINHLHGGKKGFHNVVWDASPFKNSFNEDALRLTYTSKDGEEGYPGTLKVTVFYTLTENNELKIEYSATTDEATVLNLTHHSFFNLHGFSDGVSKSINSQVLKINASMYNPIGHDFLQTGKIETVAGTPMDFKAPTEIGKRVNERFDNLIFAKGYDHNWILNKNGAKLSVAAEIFEPESGIKMSVITDQPALQFYGGNFFEGKDKGKYNEVYTYRTSFALETQHYPNSPNQTNFPSTLLNPDKKYKHVCVYKFDIH